MALKKIPCLLYITIFPTALLDFAGNYRILYLGCIVFPYLVVIEPLVDFASGSNSKHKITIGGKIELFSQ